MKIAKIIGNEVQAVGEHTELFPNTSFPANVVTEEFMQANSCQPAFNWKEHNVRSEKLVDSAAYLENGKVFVVQVAPKTQEELQADTDRQAGSLRSYRNTMLAESDWTQLIDAPVNQQAWANYRQALRDVTAQTGFPWDIQWPKAPAA